jgi:sugar phosphate isomerase/epimerase
MHDWPVGISTGCFYKTSIFDCLEHIRSAGFGVIEVCSFPAHLDYHDMEAVRRAAQRFEDLQLDPYSFHAPFADHIDITAIDGTARDRSLREMFAAAEAAAELGARHFVIHPGPEKDSIPNHERLERMERAAGSLNALANRCHQLGIQLVLENMLPHLFFGHARDVLWILGALDTIEVGICLDTGHAYLSGDLQTVAHKLSGHLWMLHASDNHGSFDDHLPPGQGKIDWTSLMSQLAELSFSGTIILEIAGGRAIDVTLEDARRAMTFLRKTAQGVT